MRVVICGGGVIGAATAFELARRGVGVTLVERWQVAGSASGKSGGFLARDWCAGTPLAPLAERSFDLHQVWADALGNSWGYRRVDTIGAALAVGRRLARRGDERLATWLTPDAAHRSRLGTRATTAQLDPAAFTRALVDAAVARGARVVTAVVAGVETTVDGSRVTGVQLEGGAAEGADAVIVALGPWSVLAARWMPLPAVYGLKGHSVVFRPSHPLPAEAIFAEVEDGRGDVLTPEVVSRADGTVYVCGLPGQGGMPVDPAAVAPEPGGCERLRDATIRLVPSLRDAEVIAMQACWRPLTTDGLPLIGPVEGLAGAFVATGHSVWGMLNAPGTAEALADVVTGGRPEHVDLTAFAPARLPVLAPGAVRLSA